MHHGFISLVYGMIRTHTHTHTHGTQNFLNIHRKMSGVKPFLPSLTKSQTKLPHTTQPLQQKNNRNISKEGISRSRASPSPPPGLYPLPASTPSLPVLSPLSPILRPSSRCDPLAGFAGTRSLTRLDDLLRRSNAGIIDLCRKLQTRQALCQMCGHGRHHDEHEAFGVAAERVLEEVRQLAKALVI